MSDRKPARHGHGQAAYPRTHKPPGCRWCGGAIPKHRRTFCSSECVHECRLRSDARYMRDQVHKRDRGVCALCGVDTEAWERAFLAALANAESAVRRRLGQRWSALCDLLRRAGRMTKAGPHTWEADHIVPVVEGGGQCGLDNLRTLCLHCHRRVTAELRARRAGKQPAEPSRQRELVL